LTKVFEEIIRERPPMRSGRFPEKTIKGEVTLIVGGGVNRRRLFPMQKIRNRIRALQNGGLFRGATASIR